MERDERILMAARELFYEKGFESVGVDDIGARAGITGPAIYRHFSSKQEVLGTLFDRALDALLERVSDGFDDPWEEIEALVRALAGFVVENPELAAVYQREDRSLEPPRRAHLVKRREAYVGRWVDCLARCVPERSTEELTSAAWAAITLLVSLGSWPEEARETPDLVGLLTAQTVGGFAALERRADVRRVA